MERTTEHRAFLVEFYFRLGGSAVGALRKLKAHLKINRNVSLPIQAEKQCNTGLRSSESQDPPELNAEFHHRRSVLPKASRKWKFRSSDCLCLRPQNTHWPWGFRTGRCEEFYIATWIFIRTRCLLSRLRSLLLYDVTTVIFTSPYKFFYQKNCFSFFFRLV